MNGKNPARHWWLVCCVVLLYHDLSVYALHRKHLRNSAGTFRETREPIADDVPQNVHLSKQRHGVCNTLVLKGLSTIPGISRNQAIGTFVHRNSQLGLKAWYQDTDDPKVHLFYDEILGKWVIGMRSEGNTSVAIQFECTPEEPQESRCGAHTSQKRQESVRWIFDPTLHLECGEDNASSGRSKRGIFSMVLAIFAFILVPIAVTNTLKSEQKRKGCLFYPSLCEKRDRIKYSLEPQIQNLITHLRGFGDSLDQLPSVINETNKHMKSIRNMVSRMEFFLHEVETKLKIRGMNVSTINLEIFGQLGFLRKDALEDYKHWLSGILTDGGMENSHLPASIYQAFLPASSSILTGFVGIIFPVNDLIKSVNEENKANQQLEKEMKELVKKRNKLVEAKRFLRDFKEIYNATIIPSLKRFVRYVKKDFLRFWNLLRALSFDKIDMHSLSLVNYYLRNMTYAIRGEEMHMERLVENVTRYDKFFSSLTIMLKEGYKFDTIYQHAQIIRQRLGFHKFETKFRLLQFIADEVTSIKCYWGMNLDLVRRREIRRNDWSKIPVCLSSEINISLELLKSNVEKNIAPCRIVRQVDDRIFGSISKVVRFLADYVIPNESCYWGYDLQSIRKMKELDSSEFPVIDSKVVYFLRFYSADGQADDVFEKLCIEKNVCVQSFNVRENLIHFANSGSCGKQKNREKPILHNLDLGDNFCY